MAYVTPYVVMLWGRLWVLNLFIIINTIRTSLLYKRNANINCKNALVDIVYEKKKKQLFMYKDNTSGINILKRRIRFEYSIKQLQLSLRLSLS